MGLLEIQTNEKTNGKIPKGDTVRICYPGMPASNSLNHRMKLTKRAFPAHPFQFMIGGERVGLFHRPDPIYLFLGISSIVHAIVTD
jgi:hypothetical protein